jgi:hypothetical protein
MSCCCLTARYGAETPLVSAFRSIRRQCCALTKLLAPDAAWSVIAADASGEPNEGFHRSYLLLAYKRGCLGKVTGPVHRFLFDGQDLHPNLTVQYRRDLQETWLSEKLAVDRHERFRRFLGKVVELQVAEWLTGAGWTLTGLEALGAKADIEALSKEQRAYSIDVKYIGQQTDDFCKVVEALNTGQPACSFRSLYGAINYVLFKVYEAARSLQHSSTSKRAIIVVDAQSWGALDVTLKHGWLNWEAPAFLRTEEEDWNMFLEKLRASQPTIDKDLADVVRTLERVWIMRLGNEYEYSLEYEYQLAG